MRINFEEEDETRSGLRYVHQIPIKFKMKGSDSPNNETEEDPEEISSSLFGGRVANKKTKKK